MIAVIRYSEIALKGRNRRFFEDQLVNNLRSAISDLDAKVIRKFGRLLVEFEGDREVLRERLSRVFGIENFSFGEKIDSEIDQMSSKAIELLQDGEWEAFRITTHRQDKTFPMKSMEVSKEVGAAVIDAFENKKVKLKDAEREVIIEITDNGTYVTGEHHKGPGGLPVGVSGKVLVMLSGGIDSPVAAWSMMKRGCEVAFIHFHSMPYTDRASVQKVQELADLLKPWGAKADVHNVPFIDIQKQIVTDTAGAYRVVLYRRFMVRIAEQYAREIGAKALVTGDAIGQVASQTIENLSVIEQAVELPILRPLLAFDKQEIMDRAQQIGTYETSIIPHGDCCALFTPRNPITKARLKDVLREEAKLDPAILNPYARENS